MYVIKKNAGSINSPWLMQDTDGRFHGRLVYAKLLNLYAMPGLRLKVFATPEEARTFIGENAPTCDDECAVYEMTFSDDNHQLSLVPVSK